MPERTIAIGDIHGYPLALDALLETIGPSSSDTIVPLGDYVDRGPDSRQVLDVLIALKENCTLIPLLGNHDEMFLDMCRGNTKQMGNWLLFGGDATYASYDGSVPDGVPESHVEFLQSCRDWYETDEHFFVHGNYYSNLPLVHQPWELLRWESLRERQPFAHRSGKTAVVGHTSQKNCEVLDLGYLKCIDTWIYGPGWLTALDVDSGQLWQANKKGRLRSWQ
jgi:serine/threonine protein phosphatase 1